MNNEMTAVKVFKGVSRVECFLVQRINVSVYDKSLALAEYALVSDHRSLGLPLYPVGSHLNYALDSV